MKRIIGGLLVISLLSRPSLLRIDFIAYEIRKASDQIIRGIRTIQEQESNIGLDTDSEDIDLAFDSVDRNKRSISNLLKDLDSAVGKMNAAMLGKSMKRETMSDEQITAFSSFNAYCAGQTAEINRNLAEISSEIGRSGLQNEIMADGADLGRVYERLTGVADRQYKTIIGINSVIRAACDTLALISNPA